MMVRIFITQLMKNDLCGFLVRTLFYATILGCKSGFYVGIKVFWWNLRNRLGGNTFRLPRGLRLHGLRALRGVLLPRAFLV
jgi:hypothetical protein